MRMPRECIYCGGLVSGSGVGDHMPLPKNVGGEITYPCCESCHDMKDRFNLDTWPDEWFNKVMADFPKLSRETRIFLGKAARLFGEETHKR